MAFAREYATTLTLNKDQTSKAARAQRIIYDSGIVNPSGNQLSGALSGFTSVLSLIFAASTPASLAAGVTSLLLGMIPSEKDALENMVKDGYWALGYLEDFFSDSPDYDMIEVKVPFIEYETANVRFVTGNCVIKRVHKKGGPWIQY